MPYQARLKKVQDYLQENACDALLVDDPVNLFYMTGLELSAGKLLIYKDGANLFVDGRYFERCAKLSPFPVLLTEKNPLGERLASPELPPIRTLGFSDGETSYQAYLAHENSIKELREYSHGKRKTTLVPLARPIQHIRAIKEPEEIKALEKAGELGSSGFDFVCTLLKEGISEEEVAMELEIFWKRKGGKKVAFDPIIAFGANSSMPHYRAGKSILKRGDPVLVDIGVNFNHYHSDMTRMIFFGAPPEQISVIHTVVQHAQQKALSMCRPGIQVGDIDRAAREFIAEQGYGENFNHNLGHGVGLEIHELPVLRSKPPQSSVVLKPGMVITIEPGIYIPNVGGVRIEDTIVITEDGYKNLTNRPSSPVVL